MSEERSPAKKTPSIATRTGDLGETSLLYGKRVSKTHPQVEACGHLDELNTVLGLAKAMAASQNHKTAVEAIQRNLIALMGELAADPENHQRYLESTFPRIGEEDLEGLDRLVTGLESRGLSFEGWATPGANSPAAAMDHARAVARRAERGMVHLKENGFPLRPLLLQFINRVSDLLWLWAREAENPPGKGKS